MGEAMASEKLSEQVYRHVIQDLIEGRITSDDVVTEKDLIERYNVSRSPVREALSQLCAEGAMVSIPRVGYRTQLVDREFLDEVIRFRYYVEAKYLEEHFDRITADDISRIRRSIRKMDKSKMNTPLKYWKITSQFHLELAESYNDRFFYSCMEQLLHKQLIAFASLYWKRWGSVIDSKMQDNHSLVLDAVESRDKALAIRLLQEDILSF